MELLQGRKIQSLSTVNMKPINFETIKNSSINWFVDKQSDYYDFIDNYISNAGNHPMYLLSEMKSVSVPTIFKHQTNNEEALCYILQILDSNKLSLYYADFSYLGFPTYRVYIPHISKVFEMKKESFEFIDSIEENLDLMMKMTNLGNDEKRKLIKKLEDYSYTYTNRRNLFQSILFRFCAHKEFDFNYLYLDFVIALLYLNIKDFKNSLKFYDRFLNEHRLYKRELENELIKVIYLYIIELEKGYSLCEIREKYERVLDERTNQYVYEIIRIDRCMEIIYWPSCPNCDICSYEKYCAYDDWKYIDNILREKQETYYSK